MALWVVEFTRLWTQCFGPDTAKDTFNFTFWLLVLFIDDGGIR